MSKRGLVIGFLSWMGFILEDDSSDLAREDHLGNRQLLNTCLGSLH